MKNAILFIGAPGSGKGTQSEMLGESIGYKRIVVGDLLRKEILRNTNLGNEIKQDMDSGNLPPNSIVMNIVEREILNSSSDGIILDGAPRNIVQVSLLNDILERLEFKIKKVIVLNVSNECALQRLLSRSICTICNKVFSSNIYMCIDCNFPLTRRSDDNRSVILNRLNISNTFCKDILSSYDKSIICIINGEQQQNNVFDDILNSI